VDPRRLESGGRPELHPASGGAGRPHAFGLRIVDPQTRSPLPEGRVGEIWLRGESIGRGYWGKPELSAQVFDARPAGADQGPSWLRTGDLGAHVEGEARDAHEALGGQVGAAFGIGSPDERVVLVHEVHPMTPKAELHGAGTRCGRRGTGARHSDRRTSPSTPRPPRSRSPTVTRRSSRPPPYWRCGAGAAPATPMPPCWAPWTG
jgi:hypothetical protein